MEPSEATPEEQEMLMFLEMLKETDPDKYKELMQEIQEKAAGFKPKLPGDGRVLGESGLEETKDEGIEIVPEPGFVIKTSQTAGPNAGRKVFINVCTDDNIAPPSFKTKLDDEGKEQQGTNVPLSLGPPRASKDRAGRPCVVYDIIVHPDVVRDTKGDETGTFRHFLCELSLNYVENKYKTPLSHQYKLPSAKYKGGTVPSQRIRSRKAPVIEEVPDAVAAAAARRPAAPPSAAAAIRTGTAAAAAPTRASGRAGAAATAAVASAVPTSGATAAGRPASFVPHTMRLVGADGSTAVSTTRQAGWAVVTFDVGDVAVPAAEVDAWQDGAALDAVAAEVAEELLVLACPGYRTTEVVLPCMCATTTATATVDPVARLVTVRVPVASATAACTRGPYAPDFGSKPWLLAHALDDTDGAATGQGDGPTLTAAAGRSRRDNATPLLPDEELPEDKFHRADIVSHHILMQRAEDAKERRRQKDEERKKQQAARAAADAGKGPEPVEEDAADLLQAMEAEKAAKAAASGAGAGAGGGSGGDEPFVDDGKAVGSAIALDLLD